MRHRIYFVYFLASKFKTLYVGITNDLDRRLAQHRERRAGTFTARYRITRLVHFETFPGPSEAITREKQIKGWRRERKIALIEAENPRWGDLAPPGPRQPDRGKASGDPSAPEGASG